MTEQTDHIAEALAAFHKDLPEVAKGATNPAFKSKYADLADIVRVVLPALAKQGLAWVAIPTLTDDGFVLRYQLRHTSGQAVAGTWPLPDPTQATPQQLGSAVTYGKRYALSAVTGIAPDADDDGNAASGASAPRAARKAPARERIASAKAAVVATTSLADLAKVWDRVQAGGLDGIAELVTAHAGQVEALAGTRSPDDAWALPGSETPVGGEETPPATSPSTGLTPAGDATPEDVPPASASPAGTIEMAEATP